MPHAGVYVLASLISGVSSALILTSSPSYTEPRSPQGAVYDVEQGQSTYDWCRARPCQVAYLNSAEDFCLWAPSQAAPLATRNTEHTLVAWCTKRVHGTRLIPDGTISGAQLVITPEYVQITGAGSLTNINIPADGVASTSGQGHSVVITSAYGQLEQIYDWTSSMSQERFCFRACKPSAAASTACQQIHDIFECSKSAVGNYDTGVFEDCTADALEVPSTLYQEVLVAPWHRPAHPFSSSMTRDTIGDVQVTHARRAVAPILATTITFPTLTTSMSNSTIFVNSSTSVTPDTPTSTPYSYNYTHTWHSHTRRLSRHHTPTSPASFSFHSSSYSPSFSSTASSPNNLSSTSSSSPSFTPTSPTSSSSDLPSGTSTSLTHTSISPTPASTPPPSFPSSDYGTSSLPSPSYDFTMPSSDTSPTLSSTPTFTSSTPQSSLVFTSTTPSSSVPSTSPASSSSSTASSMSPSKSPSMSESSYVLTSTTPSSSDPTPSSASSSLTVPNSQTQIGSQCPPPIRNAGSVISPAPLLFLVFTILMIVMLSSVGDLVL